MTEFIQAHQLNVMQAFTGICAAMVVMLAFTKAISSKRRWILIAMEMASFLLLNFDRLAYIYSGDISRTGYVMVRVSNFIVFSMTAVEVLVFDFYIMDVIHEVSPKDPIPLRLKLVAALCTAQLAFLIFAQFVHVIYSFDEMNRYNREPLFFLCYVIPVVGPLIQFSVVLQYRRKVGRLIYTSLVLFIVVPVIVSIIQFFAYGISITNMAIAVVAMFLYIFQYLDINEKIEIAGRIEREFLQDQTRTAKRLFEQTAAALAKTVDARDRFSAGHSEKVAEYSRRIAEAAGDDEEECYKVYYAALLHDVGKVGLEDELFSKTEALTKEEYERVKKHTEIGRDILSSITEYPYLSTVALSHHERYDGRGYPAKLKGDDIPRIARIVSVADAFDAMTSDRSFRDALPDQTVREEIVKGTGTQFDPKYAKIMLHQIDTGLDVKVRTTKEVMKLSETSELICGQYRSSATDGEVIRDHTARISLRSRSEGGEDGQTYVPTLIFYDSLDGHIHDERKTIEEFEYIEYCEIWLDGHAVGGETRNIVTDITGSERPEDGNADGPDGTYYEIEAVRCGDHIRVRIYDGKQKTEVIAALPDSIRFAYLALTGEYCHMTDIKYEVDDEPVPADSIPRIAEEVSYIDRMEGDLPNIQINGFRAASTVGIPITDTLELYFHTMSLPTARLIWHCPYIVIFHSDDGTVGGNDYREYALVRLDGENWEAEGRAENNLITNIREDFAGWESWKEENKKGLECTVAIERRGNKITLGTENLGVSIKNVTTITDGMKDVYICITGDQCAITDIRIRR
ncbi:MAG: HD-GYP domain-containing protein [Lachnospiraceae bacterium]|nr:HD-GYP domain-containing protein [Lachnospiraceae bacterium]